MCRITLTLSNCLKREKQSEVACLEAELAALKAKYEREHEARLKAEAENNLMKDVLNLKPDTKRFKVKEMAIIALALCKKAGILPSNKKNIATLFSELTGYSANTLSRSLCTTISDKEIEMIAQRIEPDMPELAKYMRTEKFYLPEKKK